MRAPHARYLLLRSNRYAALQAARYLPACGQSIFTLRVSERGFIILYNQLQFSTFNSLVIVFEGGECVGLPQLVDECRRARTKTYSSSLSLRAKKGCSLAQLVALPDRRVLYHTLVIVFEGGECVGLPQLVDECRRARTKTYVTETETTRSGKAACYTPSNSKDVVTNNKRRPSAVNPLTRGSGGVVIIDGSAGRVPTVHSGFGGF